MPVAEDSDKAASGGDRRLASLDGLRGAAALGVVSAHTTLHLGLLPYPTGGVTGVLVFFVLSGYLIARICWKRAPTFASYRAFTARRLQRLLPTLAGLIAVGLPLMIGFGNQPAFAALRDAVGATIQVTAFALVAGVPVHSAWSPTWSLTVEWTFYLLFPAAIWLLKHRGLRPIAAARVILATALMLYGAAFALTPEQFYLLPVANLAVMLAGAALALAHLDRGIAVRSPAPGVPVLGGLLLLLIAVLPVYTLSPQYRLLILPAVCACSLLVIHQCHIGGPMARILAWHPLGAIGERAYSLYLWHLPILWLVWVQLAGADRLVQAVVALAITAVVVPVSFHFLERPWMCVSQEVPQGGGRGGTEPRIFVQRARGGRSGASVST